MSCLYLTQLCVLALVMCTNAHPLNFVGKGTYWGRYVGPEGNYFAEISQRGFRGVFQNDQGVFYGLTDQAGNSRGMYTTDGQNWYRAIFDQNGVPRFSEHYGPYGRRFRVQDSRGSYEYSVDPYGRPQQTFQGGFGGGMYGGGYSSPFGFPGPAVPPEWANMLGFGGGF